MSLEHAGAAFGIGVEIEWLPTEEITSVDRVARFDGLWCVPSSPYRCMQGALLAIQHARESGTPFLGTCGGFQHAIIEFARNVLEWPDAEHAESAPRASRHVISPLECALVDSLGMVRLVPESRIASAYGIDEVREGYHCRYGLNPAFKAQLMTGPLRVSATDEFGDVRAVELDSHPFFVAMLFQPERSALKGEAVPIVHAFVRGCAR